MQRSRRARHARLSLAYTVTLLRNDLPLNQRKWTRERFHLPRAREKKIRATSYERNTYESICKLLIIYARFDALQAASRNDVGRSKLFSSV